MENNNQDQVGGVISGAEPKVFSKYGLKVPVAKPYLGGNETQYLAQALTSTYISGGHGEFIERFETAFAKATGAKHATACNSGTSALHVGYRLLGIQPGDEVIVPDFTMVSTVTPLIELGAIPVFVDCNEYGQIDERLIEKVITPKTKAIVAAHIYGHPVNIDAIQTIAKVNNLKVLYDAAEAHGALYKGKKLGEFGDVVCYSFYANKIITTGEGGMVTTNKIDLHEKAKKLIDEHFSDERHFWHEEHGYSYRMSNLLAAIGLAQTEKLDEYLKMRDVNYQTYKETLAGIPGVKLLPQHPDVKSVNWMTVILITDEFGQSRDEVRAKLGVWGIETRTLFIPMHSQPCLSEKRFGETSRGVFVEAERLCQRGLYLPSAANIAEYTIAYIAWVIKAIQRGEI